MSNKKVLLAYSGGLDTSYCIKYLKHELQLDVYTAIVNTGGFDTLSLKQIEDKAYQLGASSHIVLEQTDAFYQDILRFLIYGNVLKNGTYPLSVSAERVHQAKALAKYALSIDADYIAHGSTGAGNDQVRFDSIFQLVAPNLEILTPIRDQQLSRKQELDFLAAHGVAIKWEEAQYSINKGLWGTSVGGAETLTSNTPLPEKAYPSQLTAKEPQQITLSFTNGELSAVNGKTANPTQLIKQIEKIASAYAIGRDIHVGDTIIGIKGRVGFEAAAAKVIIAAHQVLEKHTLSKWQLHWKEQLAGWYGMFIHESQYFEPVMRNIETFLEATQKNVSGEVYIRLFPYSFEIEGITSPHDLMTSAFGIYGEANDQWSGEDVKGFTKIFNNSTQIYNAVNSVSYD
ncbi:argininosuccinate synthase [Fulvivirga sp. RKSG066]|uniref:argininosuccinate synthase n=1 Tax=Fulvivirga aurantia TaxID=2529383 RepID=UPI0012BBBE67|nr:argininosuccinate synthase domain-containing protein [Fulvivirga aurantia]MTI22505.1 argininosuccinate synthase [Fulvivirga aurantia]